MKATRFLKRIGKVFGLSVWNTDDGRLFFNRWDKAGEKKFWGVSFEFASPFKHPTVGLTFTRGEEREVLFGFAFFARLWVRFEHHAMPYAEEREWGVRWTLYEDFALHWYWNTDPNEGGGYLNVRDRVLRLLFGKTIYTNLPDGEPFQTLIPMPERAYPATLQFKTQTWRRPRWPFAKVRQYTDIDIPNGIPFSGKGENAWDCGEDGLFGTGSAGHSEADAIATVVKIVHRDRERRGDAWNYQASEACA